MARSVKQTSENAIGKGKAGPGRPKGSRNRLTNDVKGMILGALNKAGGETYLVEQARNNPAAFMTLVGKILPKEVTGPDGEHLVPRRIEIVAIQSK